MNTFSGLEKLDPEHIFTAINDQPAQLRQDYGDSMRSAISADEGIGITNIILAGMGGSALAGSIAKNWLFTRLGVPFELVRGSTMPAYANNHTLVVISSYSGNTAETIQAYNNARKNNCKVVCFTNGGKLKEMAQDDNITVFELPTVSQPRLAVFASLKALVCLLIELSLVTETDMRRELEDAADFLDTQKVAWAPEWQKNNLAQDIAKELANKEVIIYTSPLLGSAGYKLKIDINENAKQVAYMNVFSELNHNEMQGWIFPKEKNVASLVLASSFDSEDTTKRIHTTQEVLKDHGYTPRVITSAGSNHIQQLLYTIILGDYISAYLAILNGVDPTPVDLVEKFKKLLTD